MHKYNGTMGFQRLLKTIKSGGAPGPDSVSSSTIINGTIANADIADGAISQAKFDENLLTALATFNYRLDNLSDPGWYGTFKIKNANESIPYTITFEVFADTFNPVTNNTDTAQYTEPITLLHNQHYDLVVGIGNRLTNRTETKIRLEYTLSGSGGEIDTIQVVGVEAVEVTETYILFEVGNPFIHGGAIEATISITEI